VDLMAEQKLERRARILAAVRELLAERGWREVTIRDLARIPGCGPRCSTRRPCCCSRGLAGRRAARSCAPRAAHRRISLRSAGVPGDAPAARR
jgi:hypothetical protein